GNEEKLEQMRITVDEKLNETLTKRLDTSFKTVSEQLENVYKSLGEMKVLSTGVTENVTSLNRILTYVKARGNWAEVQLEGLLDQTIPGMFEKNVMTNPASKNIVEFAVKIPSGDDKSAMTYLPIDSKFPVESYIRLCDAADRGDTAAAEAERKALETTVINQAKEIKKYINEPVTTPFAIMYLATEGLYSEIISSKNAVAERCQSEFSVMIAGPSTITALLNSLSVGFRAMAINEKAKEVRVVLAAAKVQYDKFGVLLDKARKKINEAGKSLDDAQSRNDIIQKKLRSVEEIDRTSAEDILGIADIAEDTEE
ncbi:MAG: DNA recombination protein RmuC, partial [Clostridia bacterium]|nr:DNA recombination protein RmuC [Clostridia bacterium]